MFKRKDKGQEETLETQFAAAAARLGLKVVSIDGEGAKVEGPEGPFLASFSNIRTQWQAMEPSERPGLVDFFAKAMMENMNKDRTPSLTQARSRIRFRIAPATYGAGTGMEIKEACWEFLPGHLKLFLVIDYPTTTSFVMDSTLKEWGTTFADLYDIGYANMAAITSPRKAEPLGKLPGVRMYAEGDSYDASRAMLLSKIIDPWPPFGALFAIPTRDTLFFAPVQGPETMKSFEALLLIIRKALSEMPYAISDQVFWFDGTTWDRIPYGIQGNKLNVVPPDRFVWAMMGRTGPPPKA